MVGRGRKRRKPAACRRLKRVGPRGRPRTSARSRGVCISRVGPASCLPRSKLAAWAPTNVVGAARALSVESASAEPEGAASPLSALSRGIRRSGPIDHLQGEPEAGRGSMPIGLPESVKTVLEDKAYGHVVTFNPNGRPQVTMVWMDVEANEALFNTAERRKKPHNLPRHPRLIISVQNPNAPHSTLVLNGTATVTETGADAHADKLAKRFLRVDKYPYRQPGEKRLIVRVKVDRLGGIGPKMRPWT